MNKNCRLIVKWYLKPLFKKILETILETIKLFIKENNITLKSIKEKLKEEEKNENNI